MNNNMYVCFLLFCTYFRKISDNTLRRSDLVKIVRELTKMFRVDGDRRGFALAMNSDMFHAVVFNLEFKVSY